MMVYSYNYNTTISPLIFYPSAGLVVLVIQAVIAWIISDALSAVPIDYRRGMSPGLVWLLLIPLFHLVWNFFVFQRVSDSFQSYFESHGRPQPGDYGKGMGLAFSILAACSLIPCVNCFTGIAALVLLILTLVKFSAYKSLILHGGGGAFPL